MKIQSALFLIWAIAFPASLPAQDELPKQVATMQLPKTTKPVSVEAVAYSPDGKSLAAGVQIGEFGNEETRSSVFLFDAATGKLQVQLPAVGSALSFSPDGKLLVYGGGEYISVLDRATGKSRPLADGPVFGLREFALSPDGRTLAGITGSGFGSSCLLYDLRSGKFKTIADVGPTVASWAPMSDRLILGGADGKVYLWDIVKSKVIQEWTIFTEGEIKQVTTLARSRNDKLLAVGGFQKNICLVDLSTRQIVRRLDNPSGFCGSLAFSPTEDLLAVGNSDGRVRFWDVATGRLRINLPVQEDGSVRVAFAPDGKRFATAGENGKIVLWELISSEKQK